MKETIKTHLSLLGGALNKLDGESIKKQLNSKGYETPKNDLWHKISVVKNGQFLAMIDINESYFTVNGRSYVWHNTKAFIESIN